jgi:2-polyprenyl-3-methyl-5-hydroxy-6-metoxy-1,4-benzoquinol methylase
MKKQHHHNQFSQSREAIDRVLRQRIAGSGEIDFPCVPALLDTYMTRLSALWEVLGKPFSPEGTASLRDTVRRGLEHGFSTSPFSRLVVQYAAIPPPQNRVDFQVMVRENTMKQHYANWVNTRTPPLFGKLPDCKVMDVAASLGYPRDVPILDVGAGTGRNAIPLARLGHPVTALEVVPELAAQLRMATEGAVSLEVLEEDVFSPTLSLPTGGYRMVVLSEVTSHFRGLDDLRRVFAIFSRDLVPGGVVVVNSFLTREGYQPDAVARQIAQTAWSNFYTRKELDFITTELPFELASDESMHDYERDHLSEEEWPPTGWFVNWAQGRNIYDLPAGKVPIEMRWLVYRRR